MEGLKQFLPEIIGIILTVFIAPLFSKVGKYLKEKTDEKKHSNMYDATCILVQYAEKFFGSKTGQEKMQYVKSRLESKFPWASGTKLVEFIEVAVSNTSKELGNVES